MASEDIYVRRDVYEAGQRAIIAEIQRGNAELLRVIEKNNSDLNLKLEQYRNETKAELAQFRSEINAELAQHKNEVKADLAQFKSEIKAELAQHKSEVKAELEKFRSEFSDKLEQHKSEIKAEFAQFRSEFNAFKGEVNRRFDQLEAQVVVLTGRIDGLVLRMGSLENFVTAGIGFIAMLVGLSAFIMPISRFMRRFWRPKPTITLEQIEALIDAKLSAKQ